MNPTTAACLATIIVVGGRWAEGKSIEIKQAVGLMVAVLLLAGVYNINQKLGRMLSLVMLVSACLVRPSPDDDAYIVGIVKKLGFVGGQPGTSNGDGGIAGGGGRSGPIPRSGGSGQSGSHSGPPGIPNPIIHLAFPFTNIAGGGLVNNAAKGLQRLKKKLFG